MPELPILQRVQAAVIQRDRIQRSFELTLELERPSSVAIDMDERLVVVGGWQNPGEEGQQRNARQAWEQGTLTGIVQLWDVQTRRKLRELEGLYGAVFAVALSPDGQWLATAGRMLNDPDHGELRLWDVESGALEQSFARRSGWLLATIFSPDGTLLVTTGYNRTPQIWTVPAGKRVTTLHVEPSSANHFFHAGWSATHRSNTERARHDLGHGNMGSAEGADGRQSVSARSRPLSGRPRAGRRWFTQAD